MPAYNKPVRIHCGADSVSARLVFETRAKCQDLVARYKDDGITHAISSLFCCANTIITVRQSKSFEDREIGKQFAPLWRELADQLKVLFPEEDDEVHSSSQRLMLAHKSSALKIEETGLENQCSNCLFLVFLLKCCNGVSLTPTRPFFLPPGESRRLFYGFPFRWVLHLVLSLSRCAIVHDAASCPREGSA